MSDTDSPNASEPNPPRRPATSSSKGPEAKAAKAAEVKAASAAARLAGGSAGPKGAAARVSVVHAQARPTFVISALFAIAAGVVALVGNSTGSWLPLHLLLAGTILGVITAATQLLGVTWSSAPPPNNYLAHVQRVALFGGVALVAAGRLWSDNPMIIGMGSAAVILALILLIVSLVGIRRGAVTPRYFPALTGYMIAASFGIIGVILGATIASGGMHRDYQAIRGVHLTANALGLVGIVIISTLPFFLATQARMKMAREATPGRLHIVIGAAAASVALSLVGWVLESDLTAAIGMWAYAVVLIGSVWLFPRIKRKQYDWAGPRLVQLATGYLWWIGSVVALGVSTISDNVEAVNGSPSMIRVIAVMVIGGFAQIVSASLNYFTPVIMAGKRKPGEGLKLARSWVSCVAANIAAIGIVVDVETIAAAGIVVWILEMAYRLVTVIRFNNSNNEVAGSPAT